MERISIIFNVSGMDMLNITVENKLDIPDRIINTSGIAITDCKTKKRYVIPMGSIAYMECEETIGG